MSDRYWGKLEFPAKAIDHEVREALEAEGVEMDKLDPSEHGDDYAWIEDGIFTLEDSEARYGQFEDVENLLVLKKIPFDRESSGYYDFIPERRVFRPDMDRDMCFLLSDGDPIVKVEAIREMLKGNPDKPEKDVGLLAYKKIIDLMAYLDKKFPAYRPLGDYVTEAQNG